MEMKLQDFPCFYFTSAKANRAEQKKYYATVAAMLGYTPEEAAASSGFFVGTSKGKLFDNTAFTEEELLACSKIFESATSCSINTSRKFGESHNIEENCCVLCPLSSYYMNMRQQDEYVYLKGILENPSFLKDYAIDATMMFSMQSLTLGDDVGTYPIIPFTALFLDYLYSVDTLKEDQLHDDLVAIVLRHINADVITDSTLKTLVEQFVGTSLARVYNATSEPVSGAMIRQLQIELSSGYTYTPPRRVFPVTAKASDVAEEAPAITRSISKRTLADKIQQARELSNSVALNRAKEEQAMTDSEALDVLDEEKKLLMQEHGVSQLENARLGKVADENDDFFSMLNIDATEFGVSKPAETEDASSTSDTNESSSLTAEACVTSENSYEEEITNSDISETETLTDSMPDEAENTDTYDEMDECENVTQFFEDVPEDTIFEDQPDVATQQQTSSDASHSIEEMKSEAATTIVQEENVLDSTSINSESASEQVFVSESKVEPAEKHPLSDSAISVSELPTSTNDTVFDSATLTEPVDKMELSVVSTDPCALCSTGASATFFNNALRNSNSITYAFFLRCMNSHPGREKFSSMKNRFGCAICPRKGSSVSCVYPSLSFRNQGKNADKKQAFSASFFPKISQDMLPYVYDCTDSQKLNLIDFISEACNETHISVECVQCFGVDGLLFYVRGKYYFFNPLYGASGFLKPLLSDASKTSFYSVNPVPVHNYFYKMGFRHTRIESIAALFSTVHNISVLTPIGIIFEGYMHRALLDDMYAHIMPYYAEVFKSLNEKLKNNTRKEYENGLRLEWALGKNKDISKVAFGHEHNVMGGCYIHYRLTMRHLEDLNVPGYLSVVQLNNEEITPEVKKKIFEITAGKIAASTSRVHEYTYLLALSSDNISYYSCYENEVFFDELMACVRSAFREISSGTPDVLVTRTQFKF